MKSAEQKAKKVPAIRFAGFEDKWVNKIFRESFTYLQNNTLSRAELNSESGLAKNIHYGDVLVKFGECIDVAEEKIPFVSDAFVVDKFKNSFLQDGDIVIADTAEDETVGKCTEMQGVNDAILLSGLHTIPSRPKEKYGSKFLGYYLNSSAYHQQLLPLMQGVKVLSISKSALQETNLVIPKDNQEQQKIGSFFSNIDSLILLEQKKYDKLMQVKKSMLEKMFPKEGATVPEIRFAGFTGDWKEKKLSDEFVDFIVPMRDKPKSFDGKIPWTRIEDIEGKFLNSSLSGQYVSEKTIAQMNLKVIPKNSLIVSSSATFGVVAVVTQDLITNQTFIGLVPNDKESLDFWYIFFYSDKAREYMKSQSAGSTIFYIARESFENMPVMIPSREEQQKIGSYFSHLDSLISLQQRKLEKLKNIKKSLLEKMFV